MSLSCLIGIHRPSLASIVRRNRGYGGLCESCARPLEREENGRWTASDALYERADKAA
jgi:hypothetical protein